MVDDEPPQGDKTDETKKNCCAMGALSRMQPGPGASRLPLLVGSDEVDVPTWG